MTAMESKEEISDTDSGIILHSGKNMNTKCKNIAPDFYIRHFWLGAAISKHSNTIDMEKS